MVYSDGRLRNIRHNMSNARNELRTGGFGLNGGFPRIEIGSKLSIPRGGEFKLATLNLLTFAFVVSLNLDADQPFLYDLSLSASLRMPSSCISSGRTQLIASTSNLRMLVERRGNLHRTTPRTADRRRCVRPAGSGCVHVG